MNFIFFAYLLSQPHDSVSVASISNNLLHAMLLSLSTDSSNHMVGTKLGIVTIPSFVKLIHTIPKLKGGAQTPRLPPTHTQTNTYTRTRADRRAIS